MPRKVHAFDPVFNILIAFNLLLFFSLFFFFLFFFFFFFLFFFLSFLLKVPEISVGYFDPKGSISTVW